MSAYWPAQRWDVGAWDQALWDGQLGINVAPGSIQVTGPAATLSLMQPVHSALAADPGAIYVVGPAATLELAATLHYTLAVSPGAIHVGGNAVTLTLTRVPLPPVDRPPGVLVFGHPTYVPRW